MAGLVVIASAAGACAQQSEQLSLPNVTVTVTAPAAPVPAPYLRDPGKAYQRNPYSGRYRVEEDKFREVPCTATFIAPATGGKCLQGYGLLPGATDQITNSKGGSMSDLALDVAVYSSGRLSIEADTLIVDPGIVTEMGSEGRVSGRMSRWLRSATAATGSRPRLSSTRSGFISASP
jgi:hypothetical protein